MEGNGDLPNTIAVLPRLGRGAGVEPLAEGEALTLPWFSMS
jgi:hypothetical protein